MNDNPSAEILQLRQRPKQLKAPQPLLEFVDALGEHLDGWASEYFWTELHAKLPPSLNEAAAQYLVRLVYLRDALCEAVSDRPQPFPLWVLVEFAQFHAAFGSELLRAITAATDWPTTANDLATDLTAAATRERQRGKRVLKGVDMNE